MVETYRPLVTEIFTKVNNAKDKPKKVAVLKNYDSPQLRAICKAAFDPAISWLLPEGDVPFMPNDAPEGTEHTSLSYESRKLYHFIRGGNNQITQNKREAMFVQMLEGLHESEAAVLVAAKDKKLHQMYKGLSKNVVVEAFNWDDNFMVIEHDQYPQAPGPANG